MPAPSLLHARPTLSPLELEAGESCDFVLADGSRRRLELLETGAEILFTTRPRPKEEFHSARTFYKFHCLLAIDGEPHRLEREVPTWRSFYPPWEIAGLRIWFDAVRDIFDFLLETHGPCAPSGQARFALQDATLRICPEPVFPWCPLRADGLRINDCYNGEDCWLGPYFGASAHGGLDINHRRGTPIRAPIGIDDHAFFNHLETGHNNNRWRGFRHWPDGSTWILQCHHMTRLTVPEHRPLSPGQHYADGAGVLSGSHDHSHFVFKIVREGRTHLLDPWILFWQMYQDRDDGLVIWEKDGRGGLAGRPAGQEPGVLDPDGPG
ncbi:MAG: hypothetical protein EA425_04780 [Puniceicoccaceae bacterium]|nr:MAG: hypothetical protein EA425_04780 [Puniceicoccaceae bacterium]